METKQETSWSAVGILALACLPALSGCETPPKPTPAIRLAEVKNLGEGVYQFNTKHWPESLVDFRRENPNLTVTAMFAGEQFGGGGGCSNVSIVVVTEPVVRHAADAVRPYPFAK